MSSLTGQKIKDTYQSLLKTDDNGLITTVFKAITDGSGSASGLYLKNDGVDISGSLTINGAPLDVPFLRNETETTKINTVTTNQSIFNPTSLNILSGSTFVLQEKADYYVLEDVTVDGELIVSGSMIIDGALLGSGAVTISNSGSIL